MTKTKEKEYKFTIEIPLSKTELEILQGLSNDEMCYAYNYICDITFPEVLERKEAQKIIKRLRGLGLVRYVRGLMTEDGDVAGSGFCLTIAGDKIVKEYDQN